ncbi:hypothetical protein [Actinoplanes siamensis]|uniref:hypothetical protein n=1 Tax=Actinoplanes siamensis TaxID=1223317 RepID=UPI0035A222BE
MRRWFGHAAGLLAGAALAVTPVAVPMFRYDNPGALLAPLMTAAACPTERAGGGRDGGSGQSARTAAGVAENHTATTVAGTAIYDRTATG